MISQRQLSEVHVKLFDKDKGQVKFVTNCDHHKALVSTSVRLSTVFSVVKRLKVKTVTKREAFIFHSMSPTCEVSPVGQISLVFALIVQQFRSPTGT